MLPLRTILHPTDFSPSAEDAGRLAWSLARDHGARLVVVHVAAPPAVMFGEIVAPLADGGYQDNAWKVLRQLKWPDATVQVDLRVVQGDAVKEVLRLAKELPSDLIVVGTHGRTGFGRLVMGSVAEQILRKAPCPVVTVKSLAEDVEATSNNENKDEGETFILFDS
jgi:nucleotide-binding universal stress UspA family protein